MERNFSRGSDKRAKFIKKSKETVMEALRSRDMVLGGVTKTIVDLDETINLLSERLEYWYGIYFPELKLDDKLKFAAAVVMIDRQNIDEQALATIVGPSRANMLADLAKRSLGADLPKSDMDAMKELAQSILNLGNLRTEFDKYQKSVANELCPNMAVVAGSEIAALLVAHVGSLRRLAVLPASTIQVLGAEKALFKHLKNRHVPPPKHGIIFQHPKISSSPKAVRGKIARALANKLCLAAKADAFTKNPIGKEVKEGFESRVEQIMKEYEVAKAKGKIGPEKPDVDYRNFDNEGFGDRPPRRDNFDRPPRRERSFNNRPPRSERAPRDSFSEDRPPRRDSQREDRPRDFSDRPPRREFSDKPRYGGGDDRPRYGSDRPRPRFSDDRPRGDGPRYGSRERSDRGSRSDDQPRSDRGDFRANDERPRKSWGKRR
ncbi:MAG: hypothetical protein ACP5N9_03220 [Candidatus Bilamarchaeum sp.]